MPCYFWSRPMVSACQILLIWITTAMLCVQALGSSTLFGCCCQQGHCGRQAASADQASHVVEMSCCHQQSESSSGSVNRESCESGCAQMQTRCQCAHSNSEPALPEETTPLQTPVSLLSALTVSQTPWTSSTAPAVRPIRETRPAQGTSSHFAQLLFCVSLT